MPKVLVITSKKDGFRRCGIAHPAAATEHPIDKFTADQRKMLEAEPMLVVYEKDVPDPAPEPEPELQPEPEPEPEPKKKK
jgi:hypothetical protein